MQQVVVVGTGSAGRRHAAMLRRVLPDARITAVRRPDSDSSTEPFTPLGATVVSSLDEAVAGGVDLGVVASPAPMHREAGVALLDAGAHVLIEKPLAANLADGEALARAAGAAGRPLLVGYHLRFGDTLRTVRRRIAVDDAIGQPRTFRFEVGQHLDQWRPGTDPRRSVSARDELGGGVLLELSHELDAVRDVLGEAVVVESAHLRRDGAPTDGRVETVADLELYMHDSLNGTVHLDMVAPEPFRRWSVVGDRGTIHADVLTGRVELHRGSTVEVLTESVAGERDLAEERLIRHLVELATTRARPRCTAEDGLAVLAMVDAARRSARLGGPVDVYPTAEMSS